MEPAQNTNRFIFSNYLINRFLQSEIYHETTQKVISIFWSSTNHKEGSQPSWSSLPQSIKIIILSHLTPKGPNDKGLCIYSQLKACSQVSREMRDLSRQVKIQWVNEKKISLKTFGCLTATAAVNHVIANQLSCANLSEYKDLTDEALNCLIEGAPSLKDLIIYKTNQPIVRQLSDASAINIGKLKDLQTLILESNSIKTLDLSSCSKLITISFHSFSLRNITLPTIAPELVMVTCKYCTSLNEFILPTEAPMLKFLHFDSCHNLKKLTLPNFCPNLEKFDSCASIIELLPKNR